MKIICTESEKRAVINALADTSACYGTKDCDGNCKECVENYIEWDIKDGEQVQKEENQPKKGHWIIDEYDYFDCSCCGESYYNGCDSTKEAQERLEKGQVYTYCPYCGAYMKDGEK